MICAVQGSEPSFGDTSPPDSIAVNTRLSLLSPVIHRLSYSPLLDVLHGFHYIQLSYIIYAFFAHLFFQSHLSHNHATRARCLSNTAICMSSVERI